MLNSYSFFLVSTRDNSFATKAATNPFNLLAKGFANLQMQRLALEINIENAAHKGAVENQRKRSKGAVPEWMTYPVCFHVNQGETL